MLEKWKKAVDKGKVFGALMTDLSKAFDCLDHELLIVKVNAHWFVSPALKLTHNYLIGNKGEKLIHHIINGSKLFLEFR